MNLADYQSSLARAVRFRETPTALAEAALGAGTLSGAEAVDVYRTMYWYRLVDALFDLLPRTAHLLGKRRFTELACEALTRTPSAHAALERLALPFATFLASQPDVPTFVAEVAALEAAFVECLLAPNGDAPLLTPDHLQREDATRAHVRVHPSVRVAFASPEALAIYRESPREPEVEAGCAPRERGRAGPVVLSRPGYVVLSLAVGPSEKDLLGSSSLTILDLIAGLAGGSGSPERAFARLSTWIRHGLFTLIEPRP
jgi:hypothetical protein